MRQGLCEGPAGGERAHDPRRDKDGLGNEMELELQLQRAAPAAPRTAGGPVAATGSWGRQPSADAAALHRQQNDTNHEDISTRNSNENTGRMATQRTCARPGLVSPGGPIR